MPASPVVLLLVALTVAGCPDKSSSPPAAQPANQPAAKAARPKPAPAARAKPAATAPADKIVPAKKMSTEDLAPTVKPPGFAVIQRLFAQQAKAKDATYKAHSKGLPLGKTRFVSVVTESCSAWTVVLDKPGDAWLQTASLELPMTGECSMTQGLPLAVSLFVDDYDHDGEPEVLVRYRYETEPEPAVGSDAITDVTIVNLSQKKPPRVALSANLHNLQGGSVMPKTRGKLRHADLDGDGHPDLILAFVEKTPVPEAVDPSELQLSKWTDAYLWDPTSDSYKAPKKAAPAKKAPSEKAPAKGGK